MDEWMHPDQALDDATKFGFGDYSDLLSNVILDRNLKTPFTIAIHGNWGSGKTTLMQTIRKKIGENKEFQIKQIWFSSWEFEKLNIPLWTIFINRIVVELQDMLPEGKLRNRLKDASKEILLLAGDQLLQKHVGISFKDLDKARNALWHNVEVIASLREQLSRYIAQAIENDPLHRKRVVIFIDDLDRCLPDQSIQIFESMKLFLNCTDCVFVLGVDKGQMTEIFQSAFQTDNTKRGIDYFEKFIQLEFDLPRKNSKEVRDFLFELASNGLKENPKTLDIIATFIDPNPRRIKRWLNSVALLERLLDIQQQRIENNSVEIDSSLASIWLFIRSFFSDFASKIESDQTLLNSAIRVAMGIPSDDDTRKTGEFANDKKLTEFLSTLKPNYSINQLKDLIYLTQFTPLLNVSTTPDEIINRIPNMSASTYSHLFLSLSEENTLPLADQLINQLLKLNDWKEYQQNAKYFEFLEALFNNVGKPTIKQKLLHKILEFVEQSEFASRYFIPSLRGMLTKNNREVFLDNSESMNALVRIFGISRTFEEAKLTSAVLLEFKDRLTVEQKNNIRRFSIENDQIESSFGAKENLDKLFSESSKRKKRVS